MDQKDLATASHDERLDAITSILKKSRAESVLDLGCGAGFLLARLAKITQFKKIVGIDVSDAAIIQARSRIEKEHGAMPGHITIRHGSFTQPDPALKNFQAAALVETIEHIDPDRLSLVETGVFKILRPGFVVVTTPNRDCNDLLGVPEYRLRHPDHRFEWSREKFGNWASGVARRNGYEVTFKGIGGEHPAFGAPTQMAVYSIGGV